jgi:glutathione S-transferase
MRLLDIPYEWVETDILAGASRTPEFLARNPNGRVPLLEVSRGQYLAESNAMLCYLADGSPLLPSDPFARAKVLEWMFFEQYSHEPYIATVRFWIRYLGKEEAFKAKIDEARPKGYAALGVMDEQLTRTPFLAGPDFTVADIALYAYTHVADEGGFDLGRFGAVVDWMGRLERVPKFQPMRLRG